MRPRLLVPSLILAGCVAVAGASGLTPAPARAASVHPALAYPLGTVPAAARPWRAPIVPLVVIRNFQPPAERWLAGHRGVDLRARTGAPVRAAGAGRVTFATTLAGRGVVVVDHGRLRTTYEPVEASVDVGALVGAGAPIGTVALGSGHCGDGRCLHLGLRQGSTYLDPLLILRPTAALLRPW